VNQNNPEADSQLKDIRAAARTVQQEVLILNASNDPELHTAFATLARERPTGLLFGNDAFFVLRRDLISALAVRHAIPAVYFLREFAVAGGLMSYGDSLTDAYDDGDERGLADLEGIVAQAPFSSIRSRRRGRWSRGSGSNGWPFRSRRRPPPRRR
jgi:hypothetical protein